MKRMHIPKNTVWIGMFLLGIACIAVGLFARGEGEAVLNKAVNLCFECIGLG
ncbi:MAG: CD1871A family CXXC motif-containing protein [Clostridia bacterium]|nr:CD1871A family CXXC motif-containing protein [Clostridia bacterium]